MSGYKTSYEKQKHVRLQNKFGKISLLAMYYLTKFDNAL